MIIIRKFQKAFFLISKKVASSYFWPLNILNRHLLFISEIKIVFDGIYTNKKRHIYSVETNLRRHLHSIEKGLISENPKSIFGAGYIASTITNFIELYSKKPEASTNAWAIDLLVTYFGRVKSGENSIVDQQKARFAQFCSQNNIVQTKPDKIPYQFSYRAKSDIDFARFHLLLQQRRSVRKYKPIPVPREQITKAIDAALLAPSGCNRQPFEFFIIDEKELIDKVSSIPPGAKNFAHSAPVMIFVVVNMHAYFDDRDRHLPIIDASLATMSLILSLETIGISSCVINIPEEKLVHNDLRNTLHFEKYQKCITAVSVGYPHEDQYIPYSYKKNAKDVIKFNNRKHEDSN